MTPAELRARLEHDEDPCIERKTQGQRAEVVRTVVAFANSVPSGREAVLFIGVRPDKIAVGVSDVDTLQRSISDWVKDECYPPIGVMYEVLRDLAPLPVLAVIVPASKDRPHFAGPAYVRDGSKTVKASAAIYEDLITGRHEKAGPILQHKGEVITVVKQERWVATWNAPERVIPIETQCRIESCSPHSVELRNIATSVLESVPLDRVILTADPKHLRPLMLTIKTE